MDHLQQYTAKELANRIQHTRFVHLVNWLLLTLITGMWFDSPWFVAANALVFALYGLANIHILKALNNQANHQLQTSINAFSLVAAIIGLHWGGVTGYFLIAPEFSQVHLPFLAFISVLGVMGAVNTAFSPLGHLPFILGVYVPTIAVAAYRADSGDFTLVALFLIFLSTAFKAGKVNLSLVQAAFQKERLLQERSEELERLSITDGLTGIYNRMHFDDCYLKEWKRAHRQGQSIALLLIDLDNFKQLNDEYGHQAGDLCLQATAQLLQASLGRANDLLARYGGEEFIVILPATSALQAEIVAYKIIQALRDLRVDFQTREISLSASIGIAATVPDDHQQSDRLIAEADHALYMAKDQGRDQQQIFQPPEPVN